jgi:hypothetical protein
MPAALQNVGLNASITWLLNRAVTGFSNVIHGTESALFSSNALPVATWDELFAAQYVIAPAGTQVVDLRSFTDLPGNAVVGTKAMAIIVLVTGAVGDKLNVKPNAANGLQWFFEDPAKGINIPGGGMAMFSEGPASPGTTIDATHKQLLLTNNGAAPLTVKVVALVSDL